jgi:hypothetical protein
MATLSSAGGGSSMSNAGVGTRGLSAGDWIRLKRINGAKGYGLTTGNASSPNGTATSAIYPRNKDISPPEHVQRPYGTALLIPYEGAGTPKTIRTASDWINYVASQEADYVSSAQTMGANGIVTPAITQTITKVCNASADSTTIQNKPALPMSNQFNRMKIVS